MAPGAKGPKSQVNCADFRLGGLDQSEALELMAKLKRLGTDRTEDGRWGGGGVRGEITGAAARFELGGDREKAIRSLGVSFTSFWARGGGFRFLSCLDRFWVVGFPLKAHQKKTFSGGSEDSPGKGLRISVYISVWLAVSDVPAAWFQAVFQILGWAKWVFRPPAEGYTWKINFVLKGLFLF